MAEPLQPPALPEVPLYLPGGAPVVPPAGAGSSVIRQRGRIKANLDMAAFELPRSLDRWVLPFEAFDDPIDVDRFKDMIEDRDIPFTPGITEDEAQRRIDLYEFNQREAIYERYGISQFVTGMVSGLPDPVNVLTLPFGGPAFAAAKRATTWRGFLGNMTWGGAQAGAASLPLEYLTQQAETGQIETGRLLGSAVGPIVAAPALGAVVRGFSQALGRRASMTHPPETVAQVIEYADANAIPIPHVSERMVMSPVPTQRLRETFSDYEGGWVQFVRDLAARRESALTRMRRMGLGPDDEVAVRLLRGLAEDSDARAVTPVDYNLKLMDLFNRFRSREDITPDDLRMLVDNGLVKVRGRMERTKPRVRLTPGRPRVRLTGEQLARVRITGEQPGKPLVRASTTPMKPRVRLTGLDEQGRPRVRSVPDKPRFKLTGAQPGKPRIRITPGKPRVRLTGEEKPRIRIVDPGSENVRFVEGDGGAEISVLGRQVLRALVDPDKPLHRRLLREISQRGMGALRNRLRTDPRLNQDLDDLGVVISTEGLDPGTIAAHIDLFTYRAPLPDPRTAPLDQAAAPASRPRTGDEASDAGTPSESYEVRNADEAARDSDVSVEDIKEAAIGLFDGATRCGI